MVRLPAEWEPQAFVQFTFPHQQGDWAATYDEVVPCFVELIETTARFQPVLVVCSDLERVRTYFTQHDNLHFAVAPSNDTWARDHGAITILNDGKPQLLDFQFNGWGNKFPAELDNQITRKLHTSKVFGSTPLAPIDFVLEGGAIESDGAGTLLTTSTCLLSENRNPQLEKAQIEVRLKQYFALERILWLDQGYLAGDDTDAHIDTLVRLCDEQTIAYVQCLDSTDEHFEALQAMEAQLKTFKTAEGQSYKLVSLPMADPCYDDDGDRMPATYANFLICNGAVLAPSYGVAQDEQALETLRTTFPDREVIGINCLPLIQQHGSLHCVTMQYPAGVPLNV
ncbi:MAG: agmatine deiminase family protein [Cyclobacteriaceae bacterium]